jgi:hypothetical protein
MSDTVKIFGTIRCACLKPLQESKKGNLTCANEQCSLKGAEISANFWVTAVSDMSIKSRWAKFELCGIVGDGAAFPKES